MSLSPLNKPEDRFVVVETAPSPSRTYLFDFDTGELQDPIIDGEEAIRQFIHKAILTARYRYLIYNGQYGCEIDSLLGGDISQQLLKSEVVRVITEALKWDDRVQKIDKFQIVRDSDKLLVTFTVHTNEGVIEQEVNI